MYTVLTSIFRLLLFLLFLSREIHTRRFTRQAADNDLERFKCINGGTIGMFSACDGAKDCSDGSDETLATCSNFSIQCPAYAFRCAYGACVDRDSKCNGVSDCADNSDELLPECQRLSPAQQQAVQSSTCRSHEFKCGSGQCINEYSVCDGTADCSDGSDETIPQCININCPPYAFQCAYGACVDRDKKCNGVKDCNDGSDEDPELCRRVKPPTTKPTIKPPKSTPTPPSGKCVLPEEPAGGNFSVSGCKISDRSTKCRKVAGTFVDPDTLLNYACNEGYTLPENSKRILCLSGTWDPEIPKCLKLCRPLISTSLDIKCVYRGDEVSCENPMRPGTKIYPKCKFAFLEDEPNKVFIEAICRPDGEWSSPLFKCIPACGKPSKNVQETLISGGIPAVSGDYPWHVGLYTMDGGSYTQSCGGTLLSPHVVLTAAHCIYVETENRVLNPSELKVAAGKLKRSWYSNDPKQQQRDVREIIKPDKYEGYQTSYAQDIAIIDLVSPFILSDVILPACLDKGVSGYYTPSKGALGTAVGWGNTEENKPSEILLYAKLPYLDYEECWQKSPVNFKKFITYDKFCAGYDNGTGVQGGDSGGGLTFAKRRLHFVYGVVSLKPKNVDSFAVFTNVSAHISWIENVMNAISFHHPQ